MRKILLIATMVAATFNLSAAQVELSTAQQTAQRFLMSRADAGRFTASVPQVKWVHTEPNSSRTDLAAYYIVNTDRGFVIVAGDDRAQEVLACGETPLDLNAMPENMKFWLDYYKTQMEFLEAHPGLMVEKPALRAGNTVAPLLEATWDQGYPYYSQCPMDGDRRSLTGCATTSLAQVFYKWQYPFRGEHSVRAVSSFHAARSESSPHHGPRTGTCKLLLSFLSVSFCPFVPKVPPWHPHAKNGIHKRAGPG